MYVLRGLVSISKREQTRVNEILHIAHCKILELKSIVRSANASVDFAQSGVVWNCDT